MLRFIERFLVVWGDACRRAGWFVVVAFLVGAAMAGVYAANNLKVNTDTSEMLDPELPFQKNAAALRDAFPQLKTDLVIIVRGPTLDETDAFAAALRERLLADPMHFSAVFSPAQEPFFQENGLLYLELEDLESRLTQMSKAGGLIETLVQSPTLDTLFLALAENARLAERSEIGRGALDAIYSEMAEVVEASMDGKRRPFSWMGALDTREAAETEHIRIVYATPVLDFTRLQPAKAAIERVHGEIALVEEGFDGRVETFVTGDPALRAEELQSVTEGVGLSFLLSFALVAVLLVVCYRSISLAVITMTALVVTLTLTSGFTALAVGELNLVSIAFTVLLVGFGLHFAIHLLLHLEEHRGAGESTPQALRASMRDVGSGIVLAAVTTAIGFFSFIPTKFDGIAQLGLIAGVGVMIALGVTVTFAPAALGLFPKSSVGRKFRRRKSAGVMKAVRTPLALVAVALGGVSLFYLPQTRFDADPMRLRDPEGEAVRGFFMLFSSPETIPYRLSLLVESAEQAEAAAARAKRLPAVRAVRSLPDFVPADQDEKLELISFASGSLAFALEARPSGGQSPPPGRGLAALEGLLASAGASEPGRRLGGLLEKLRLSGDATAVARVQDNVFAYWPQLIERLRAQLNADYVEIDALPEALASRYRSADGKWRLDILPKNDVRSEAALNAFVDAVEKEFPNVSGGALQTKKAGEIISSSMAQATTIAFAVIAVFLWLLVRRIALVLMMLAPLALAAVLTAAAGVILDIPFNYANVIVLPLLLGAGVDNGIHLVLRQQQIEAHQTVYESSTPRAMVFSALTTIGSFGTLALSDHRGTASMGELLSIALLLSLACALFVLPAAFALGERIGGRKPA
jgi:hypothetical protein